MMARIAQKSAMVILIGANFWETKFFVLLVSITPLANSATLVLRLILLIKTSTKKAPKDVLRLVLIFKR